MSYIASLLAVCSFAVAYFLFRRWWALVTAKLRGYRVATATTSETNGSTDSFGDSKQRAWGVWTQSTFVCPEVAPCRIPLQEIKPRPYRPFKPGPYHVTMGIKPMPWDEWIELDGLYVRYHSIRANRVSTRGSRVVRTLPARDGLVSSGAEAAKELLQELSQFLSRRYPDSFKVVRCPRSHAVSHVTVLPLDITYALEGGMDPLQIAALLVQDDLAILIEGNDGKYYLQGGAILVAGSWRLEEKIGMSLDEIHLSGDVPQYPRALQPSLTKFFRRLKVDNPFSRNNYGFQVVGQDGKGTLDPDELAWCSTTNGPEDHPALHGDQESSELAEEPVITPSTILFRSERQTLRRLPRTGAVIFTIRTYLTPIEELAKEPGVPSRLASAVRGWDEEVWKYKKGTLYGEVLLDYLDSCENANH